MEEMNGAGVMLMHGMAPSDIERAFPRLGFSPSFY
jgi:hypothetical protein